MQAPTAAQTLFDYEAWREENQGEYVDISVAAYVEQAKIKSDLVHYSELVAAMVEIREAADGLLKVQPLGDYESDLLGEIIRLSTPKEDIN